MEALAAPAPAHTPDQLGLEVAEAAVGLEIPPPTTAAEAVEF
jgi:hypothetical protein